MSTLLSGSLYQQFQLVWKTLQTYIQAAPGTVVTSIRLESYFVDDGQEQLDSHFIVHDRTGYYGIEFVSQFNSSHRSIDLAVNPARESFDRSGRWTPSAVAADVLRGGRNHLEQLILSGKRRLRVASAVYLLAIVFVFLTLSALYNRRGCRWRSCWSVRSRCSADCYFVGAAYLVSPEFINQYLHADLVGHADRSFGQECHFAGICRSTLRGRTWT